MMDEIWNPKYPVGWSMWEAAVLDVCVPVRSIARADEILQPFSFQGLAQLCWLNCANNNCQWYYYFSPCNTEFSIYCNNTYSLWLARKLWRFAEVFHTPTCQQMGQAFSLATSIVPVITVKHSQNVPCQLQTSLYYTYLFNFPVSARQCSLYLSKLWF